MANNNSAPNFPIDDLPTESAVTIDLCAIDDNSKKTAMTIISDITKLYADENWVKEHPIQKRRLDIELETLRGLLKMRQADEQAHDALIEGISANNGNASLYKALADIQRTSLQVTDKINQTINTLTNLMEKFQLDNPVEQSDNSNDIANDSIEMTRGSKEFITKMNQVESSNSD